MSENNDMVENEEFVEESRLNTEDETLYIQTSNEYDRIFSRAQMSVVDKHDIRSTARLCGPSGCGKTTLARSLAIDVKIADTLINAHDLPVWEMEMDKLAVFHHIVTTGNNTQSVEKTEKCPSCGSQSIYERSRKTPAFRCQNCSEEFDNPETEVEQKEELEFLSELEHTNPIQDELETRNLVNNGDQTDLYPHSRAEAYRDIYKVYEGTSTFPSSPYFEITMSHAKYAKDLIGHPHIGEDGTTFIKGKVTKAVEASNEEPTILTLDEINRAPTSAKDELYDALDGRVKVSMDEVGGVEITGNPSNLIIVSTMNKGSGHHVEPLDFAEKRRLSDTYYVDFLGVEYPEKEIELVETLTPVSNDLASEMVRTANEIRQTAAHDNADLSYGVPTGTLLEWANGAYTNNLAGISEPVVQAGDSSVARAIYDHSEEEVSEVKTIISKNMQGVDFFRNESEENEQEEESNTSNSLSETRYMCNDDKGIGCSWSATESKAPAEAAEFLICPECEGVINERNPGE